MAAERVTGEAEPRRWPDTAAGRAFDDAMVVHVVERAGVRSGRLISVSDDDGAFAARLAALLPEVEVLGLDLSGEAVEEARERYRAPNLRFARASATDVARHGPAEAVVAMQAFHHFDEPTKALREMFRAVAPGGSLLLIDLRRDADTSAYLRRLDGYVSADRFGKARLLRASVAAAHTGRELLAMTESLDGAARLGRLRWTPAAQAAYARVEPDSLARVLEDLTGLMVELHLVRPREYETRPRPPRRTDASADAPRVPRGKGVEPFVGPDARRLVGGAGAGAILWDADGEQLWSNAAAREHGRRCPAGWGDLLAADARRIALDTSPAHVIERTFALSPYDKLVARSGRCDEAGTVAVVTTLEQVHTTLDLGALATRCGLTTRELDVAKLVAAGLGNREVGVRLGIASPTVGQHLTHLYQKTRTSGRLELARLILLAQGAQPAEGKGAGAMAARIGARRTGST